MFGIVFYRLVHKVTKPFVRFRINPMGDLSNLLLEAKSVNSFSVQEDEEATVTVGTKRASVFKNQVAPAGTRSPDSREEDSQETIPVKGTLTSAGFVVLLIVLSVISVGIKMDDLTRTLLIKLFIGLFRALRCPLVAFVTYRARKSKAARIPN